MWGRRSTAELRWSGAVMDGVPRPEQRPIHLHTRNVQVGPPQRGELSGTEIVGLTESVHHRRGIVADDLRRSCPPGSDRRHRIERQPLRCEILEGVLVGAGERVDAVPDAADRSALGGPRRLIPGTPVCAACADVNRPHCRRDWLAKRSQFMQ